MPDVFPPRCGASSAKCLLFWRHFLRKVVTIRTFSTYEGAAIKYDQPSSVSQAGDAESASEAGCWLKTVRSEESLCSYGRPTIREGHSGRRKPQGRQRETTWQIRDTWDVKLWICSSTILRCKHAIMATHLEYHCWAWHGKNIINLQVTAEDWKERSRQAIFRPQKGIASRRKVKDGEEV